MKKTTNPKVELLEHSKAKVELYQYYLSIYLNILHRANFQKIYIYDLFAGEGVYENDEKGSPIITCEKILEHYIANNNSCPNIKLLLNDSGFSEIEKNILKIDRVKTECNKIDLPKNVEIEFDNKDYNDIIDNVLIELNSLEDNNRALVFLDPYGYKDVDPDTLRSLLSNGKTEIILFLPIHFMWRFYEASQDDSFQGGLSLRTFTLKLFNKKFPKLNGSIEFINALKDKFKDYLQINYVDTFTIERERNQFFCLFFFTNYKIGFQRMLETKWKLDEKNGKGFSIDRNNYSLFDTIKYNYKDKLINFIKENAPSNIDLLDFGLFHGFLPKHTNEILNSFKNEIKKTAKDDKVIKGNYIGREDRFILFSWKD